MHSTSSLSASAIPTLNEKRGTQSAIPAALARYLNDLQIVALHSLESFGWRLAFIRRPLFLQATVVVSSPDGHKTAVLEEDGSVNMDGVIQMRH